MSNLARISSARVLCLRNMIAEIDAMKSLPTAEEIQEMIVRWQVVELGLHKTEEKGKRGAALINEHTIQLLLKTRKFRDAQKYANGTAAPKPTTSTTRVARSRL